MLRGFGHKKLLAELGRGGRIDRVLVLVIRTDAEVAYAPYVVVSWRQGFFPIRAFAKPGGPGTGHVRTWRDFTKLLAVCRDELGYAGAIAVHEAGDPILRKYRTLASAAAAWPCATEWQPTRGWPGAVSSVEPPAGGDPDERGEAEDGFSI